MQAGKLDKRVTLQQLNRTADGAGGWEEVWANVATVWARVSPLRGGERYEAQRVQANLSHKVTIRHRAGTTPAMRILYGTRVLQITAVIDPDERHEVLELLCEEQP